MKGRSFFIFISRNLSHSLHNPFISINSVIKVAFLLISSHVYSATNLSLSLEDISHPFFQAKNVTATIVDFGSGPLQLQIGELTVKDRSWHKVKMSCWRFVLSQKSLDCHEGKIGLKEFIPISFNYFFKNRTFMAELKPTSNESWKISAKVGGDMQVSISNGSTQWLSSWLPEDFPKSTQGQLSGLIQITGTKSISNPVIHADLAINNLAFTDVQGLRAGEKLVAKVSLRAQKRTHENWQWNLNVDWKQGDIFWEPFYVSSTGYTLKAKGNIAPESIHVEEANVNLVATGNAKVSALWNRKKQVLQEAEINAPRFKLEQGYTALIQPLLKKTLLAQTTATGEASVHWIMKNGVTQKITLDLKEVSLRDNADRFALNGINTHIPWQRQANSSAQIAIQSAKLGLLPLGKINLTIEMQGLSFRIPQAGIPLLDGQLNLTDFRGMVKDEALEWQVSSDITPISMELFTQTFKVPLMYGTFSAVIPNISYQKSTLTVGGALLFKVFDGTVVAKNLSVIDPGGALPVLRCDLDMNYLDLNLFTRTFSFGSIEGRMDATVTNLELVKWQPQRFVAKLISSPGTYPKVISQHAVQNIAALGGGGAMAILQTGFLKFFDQFRYDKIGLGCVLQNGVCQMSGIEPATQGGYVIIKGGGIPALDVIGYNRAVGWNELVDRVKNIVSGNAQMIIK